MSREFDARARRAASNLKAAVEVAELTSIPPGTVRPSRPLFAVLRPALIAALLVIGSAVGIAVMMEPSPPSPAPVVVTTTTTTTMGTSTTLPTTIATAPVPPASAYVAPAPTKTPAPDLDPPPLVITSPDDGADLDEETVTFSGTTEPGARVFAGKWEADVDPAGDWRIVLILNEGSNAVRFTARDAAGNESQASVTVYYIVEQPTTTTTIEKKEKEEERDLAEFSAYATFGTCSETPPYDVYYGTGEPGSIVEVSSEYGSGSVEVGAEGHWELKVHFEGAPPNAPFVVRVIDQHGRKAEFEFSYLPA